MYVYLLIGITLYLLHWLISRKPPTKLTAQSKVLITGACMGIGKQTALMLAKKYGCRLIIIDIRNDLFKNVSQELQAAGSLAEFYRCDLSNSAQIEETMNQIKQKYPKIDVLVNNAGIVFPKHFDESSIAEARKSIQVNYLAPVQIINSLLKNLEGGHIVNIASVAGFFRGLKMATYIASKHAIFGYHSVLRMELIHKKIPISCSIICPYAINTTMFQGFKTRMEYLMPILDEKYVAKVVLNTIINKKQVVVVTTWVEIVIKIISLLPVYVGDKIIIWLDQSNYSALNSKKTI